MDQNFIIYADARDNKAALLLASMSPDMVEDIINLISSRGRSIIADLARVDSMPAPLFVMSRRFVSDKDFPSVFVGLSLVIMASLRDTRADLDFYEQIIEKSLDVPTAVARKLAQQIETEDAFASTAEFDQASWVKKMSVGLAETVRDVVNWSAERLGLPWENDQTQMYDIDFLYELSQLGRVAADLYMRGRLIKGQAAFAKSQGWLVAGVSKLKEKGDIYDDTSFGDPDIDAEVEIVDAVAPLMGTPLPLAIFGGIKDLVAGLRSNKVEKAKAVLAKAGVPVGGAAATTAPETRYVAAMQRVLSGDMSPAAQLVAAGESLTKVKGLLDALAQASESSGQMGDIYQAVREDFGDVIADEWASGSIPRVVSALMAEDALPFPTTGDPNLDERILAQCIADTKEEMGDLYDDLPEMGGLFSRLKAKRAVKRASRRARKDAKLQTKLAAKMNRTMKVANARRAAMEIVPEVEPQFVDSSQQYVSPQGFIIDPESIQDPAMNPYYDEDFLGDWDW